MSNKNETVGFDFNYHDRKNKSPFYVPPHSGTRIKKVIGIVSGKGGVGKSLVSSLLAVTSQRRGFKTAILDADITGPSIPKAFGVGKFTIANEHEITPPKSKTGISIMSLNLITEHETDPVVWRGPLIANMVKQFWTDVIWGDIDYMFIDMPPGTGDVPLTVFQSLDVDGIVIVATPQELVGMIVEKAVRMAEIMEVPILALVENMSYMSCPHCGEKISVFGESRIEEIAAKHGVDTIARIPIDPELAKACDNGGIEDFKGDWLDGVMDKIGE